MLTGSCLCGNVAYEVDAEPGPIGAEDSAYAGGTDPYRAANTLFADPYTLFGLKLGYRSDRGLGGFVEGRNLGDRTYAATTGVIADARGRDSAQFLPGDGRSVFAGLDYRW
jgi:outer membrane receptor protein involved in Fe transport